MTFFASTPGTRLGSIGALGMALVWTALTFGAATAPVAAQNPGRRAPCGRADQHRQPVAAPGDPQHQITVTSLMVRAAA